MFKPHLHANWSKPGFVTTRGPRPQSRHRHWSIGIDIGDVESVAQVGPGWSVASLRQRLGRSGRRAGKPAVLRMYIPEEEFGGGLHPSNKLRLDLAQAVEAALLVRPIIKLAVFFDWH